MKLKEIKQPKVVDARYRVTLSTHIGGVLLAWQTRLSAGSQQEAVSRARAIFRKQRGEIQDAVLRKWDVREVTPITQYKR